MKDIAPDDAWELLEPEMTQARLDRIKQVIGNRTRHVRLVVQDIHHPHNVSACLRSAEAFGVQYIHVVTLGETFASTSVAKGSRHWLTIERHKSVDDCVATLRKEGFKIAAGMPPHSSDHLLGDIPVSQPIALLFGNEHEGVSDEWKEHIDLTFSIPMYGMVESLNISVSAAITMQRITERARNEAPSEYFLTENQKKPILNEWVYRQFKRNDNVLARLREKRSNNN